MTLLDFAYKNVSRDFKTYMYHFFSCIFSVFVYFLFSTLAYHPSLSVVDKNSSIGLVLFLGGLVSALFSFVLILYSVGNFLKQRSRQFAFLNIIGTSNKQFKKIVFFENGIISIAALIAGITLGMVFIKFFLMIAEAVIGGLSLHFYFPVKALLITMGLMGGLFLAISIIAPIIMRKKNVIDLLKKEDEAEKSHLVLFSIITALVLPVTVYLHKGENTLTYPFYLASYMLLTYIGLNLLFKLYSFIMKASKRDLKGSGLVKVSNFKYIIHTNLKTMTVSLVLFSIILTSFVLIVGAPRNVEDETMKIIPYSYIYGAWDKSVDEEAKAEKVEELLKDKEGYKSLEISYLNIPVKDSLRSILMSNTMYNDIAKYLDREQIQLKSDGYFMVGSDGKSEPVMGEALGKELENSGITEFEGKDKRVIGLSGYFSSVTVISDGKYEELASVLEKDRIYAFDIKDWKNTTPEKDKALFSLMTVDGRTESFVSAFRHYSGEKLQRSIMAYVGSILCVSFLIGIGSVIYSRLYSLSETEINKYKVMVKLGMDRKTVKSILASTIKWIFVVPFMGALIVAWILILNINQFTLTSYIDVAIACSIVYILIEAILYFTIKAKYQKTILNGINT